jgi:hypothetical protein
MTESIALRFIGANGIPQYEPVHGEFIDGGAFVLLQSPGFVYGLAAGDEIELGETKGSFQLLARGGNIAVRLLSEKPLGAAFEALAATVEAELDGRADGRLGQAAVFTVPAASGFDNIEQIFNDHIDENPGTLWEYGNVYDDQGEPLEWWL